MRPDRLGSSARWKQARGFLTTSAFHGRWLATTSHFSEGSKGTGQYWRYCVAAWGRPRIYLSPFRTLMVLSSDYPPVPSSGVSYLSEVVDGPSFNFPFLPTSSFAFVIRRCYRLVRYRLLLQPWSQVRRAASMLGWLGLARCPLVPVQSARVDRRFRRGREPIPP